MLQTKNNKDQIVICWLEMNLSQNKIRLTQLLQNNKPELQRKEERDYLILISLYLFVYTQMINNLFLLTQNNNKKQGSLPSCIIKIISKIKDYPWGRLLTNVHSNLSLSNIYWILNIFWSSDMCLLKLFQYTFCMNNKY